MIPALLLMAASSVLQADPADAPAKPPLDFTSKEGGFSVILPAKPTEAIKEVPTPAGPLVNKIFQASDGKSIFTVVCADFPGDITPEQVEPLLDGIRTGYVSSTNGKVTEDKKVRFEELPGREVTLEVGEAIQRARYFLRGDRIYQLIVVQTRPNDNPEAFRRFVASFRLKKIVGGLKEAPIAAAGWEEFHSADGGYRVRMIGKPVEQVHKIPTPAGPVAMHASTSLNGLGESYIVYHSPVNPGAEGLAPDALLDSVVAGAIANQPGSKLIAQRPITLGAVAGREAEIELPANPLIENLTFFVHYYAARGRLYQVAFIGSKDNIKTKPVADFLASFRFDPPVAATKPEKEARP